MGAARHVRAVSTTEAEQPAARPRLVEPNARTVRIPASYQARLQVPGSQRLTRLPGSAPNDQIARRVAQAASADELIEIFAGMPARQRAEVAQAWLAQAQRRRVPGDQALAALTEHVGRFGNRAERVLLEDIVRPENQSGIISDAATVHLDLQGLMFFEHLGIGAPNHEAAAMLLERRSQREIDALDGDLRNRFGSTLAQRVDAVPDARGRARLQFLTNRANRDRNGELSPGAVDAWSVREGLGGFSFMERFERSLPWNDDNSRAATIQQMLTMTPERATAMRRQYANVRGDGPRIPEPTEEVRGLGDYRLRQAARGLALDPDRTHSNTVIEDQTRQVARYIAATILHREQRGATRAEVEQAVAMVRPNLASGQQRDGRASFDDVARAYYEMSHEVRGERPQPWRGQGGLSDAERARWKQNVGARIQGDVPRADVDGLLAGRGADSPQARAGRIARAAAGNFVGPYLDELNRALDLSRIPAEQRPRYLAEMRATFRQGGRDLDTIVRERAGRPLTLPTGRQVPSQAMATLAANGTLSDEQRIMYALHDKGPMGAGRPRLGDIGAIGTELTPLDRHLARQRYQALTGGNLLEDLGNVQGYEARLAESAFHISPSDNNAIATQLITMTVPLSAENLPPGVSLRQAQAARDRYWATVFPDRAQREAFLRPFQGPGAPQAVMDFAARAIDRPEVITGSLQRLIGEAEGTRFAAAVTSIFGHRNARELANGKYQTVRNLLAGAAANGWREQDLATIPPQQLAGLIAEVRARARQQGVAVDRLSDQAVTIMTLAALGLGGGLNPLAAAGLTALARVGARAATGRLNGQLMREAMLGALPGLTFGVARYFPTGLVGTSLAGGFAYSGFNLPNHISNAPLHDPAVAFEYISRNSGRDFVFGTATTAAFYAAMRAMVPKRERPPTSQQPGGNQPTPGRGEPPLDRPVTPDRPTNPGGRPGVGPTQTSTPGGPPQRPSVRPDVQTGTTRLPAERVSSGVRPSGSTPARDIPARTQPVPPRTGQHGTVGSPVGERVGSGVVPAARPGAR
ncbi:MAG: hypothetical protein ACAI38_23620 [Myxococcota bacterium]